MPTTHLRQEGRAVLQLSPGARPAIRRWPRAQRLLATGCALCAPILAFMMWLFPDGGPLARLGIGVVFGQIVPPILAGICALLCARHLGADFEDLEEVVDKRTRQMTALLQLTKAVNNTLLVEQVLAQAAEHTRRALHADAVALWLLDDFFAGTSSPAPLRVHRGLEDQPETLRCLAELPLSAVGRGVSLSALMDENDVPLPIGTMRLEPLLWQGQCLGSIGALRWNGDFDGEEISLIESIGLEVGGALENARMYATAVDAADRDPVTGLLNHRAIHGRYETMFARAEEGRKPLSVIMMDLNNFKLFNDTYGHPVGDEVLRRVALVLKANCRTGDIVGRYGGDEFIMVMPDTDSPHAIEAAGRLRDCMTREGYLHPDSGVTIPITMSFGVASYPQDSTNRNELIPVADANLYVAKNGRQEIRATSDIKRAREELLAQKGFSTLDALITAVDNKDCYTRQHSEDVTEYALWIADEMGLDEATKRQIRVGGMLHDVGKICVPDIVLRKPAALSGEEYGVMQQHPCIGALIVGTIPGLGDILDIVKFHHERWDGKGYPEGLRGEAIPLLGRLLAVADAFSAMTTARPYRKGLSWEAALQTIHDCSGSQFDPLIAGAFLRAAAKRGHVARGSERPALEMLPPAPAESRAVTVA